MNFDFQNWLHESISEGNADRAAKLISSYLQKKTGIKFVRMAGVEIFDNSHSQGFGIRFFYEKDQAIRFNWANSGDIGSSDLVSIDVWDGEHHDPSWNVDFDHEASLVTILPFIADILSGPIHIGDFVAVPADNLNESADEDLYDKVVATLKTGEPVPVSGILSNYGSRGEKILNALRMDYPHLFEKVGRSLVFRGTDKDLQDLGLEKDKVVQKIGGVKVVIKKGGSNDTVNTQVPAGVPDGSDIEKIAYEDQLDDLKSLIALTVKGASNALFIAGRGGVGKTHTVETTLNELGLRDGDGYFKQTGSASPAGIYRLLFQYKDSTVMFDDADGALSDQDGRNLIKAATDTKKVRKLAWAKTSKNLIDPSVITPEQIDQGFLPTSYEFTGRIIFISNLSTDKLDPDRALRTRALMISIDPTDQEVIEFMRKIVDRIPLEDGNTLDDSEREEVIVLIDLGNKADLNIRKLVRSLNIRASAKAGGVNSWERLIKLYA